MSITAVGNIELSEGNGDFSALLFSQDGRCYAEIWSCDGDHVVTVPTHDKQTCEIAVFVWRSGIRLGMEIGKRETLASIRHVLGLQQ